jgi:hypothetical protein
MHFPKKCFDALKKKKKTFCDMFFAFMNEMKPILILIIYYSSQANYFLFFNKIKFLHLAIISSMILAGRPSPPAFGSRDTLEEYALLAKEHLERQCESAGESAMARQDLLEEIPKTKLGSAIEIDVIAARYDPLPPSSTSLANLPGSVILCVCL